MEAPKRKRRWRLVVLLITLAGLCVFYVDRRQDRLNMALIEAVNGDLPVRVHELLEQGADANTRMVTPGAPASHVSVWERLIALFQRRPVPARSPSERNHKTVLMLAARLSDPSIAADLIAHGADVHVRLPNGNTALLIASRSSEKTAVKLVSMRANSNVRDRDGKSPLLFAAERGYDQLIQALIDRGVDLNGPDKEGVTPLLVAARSQHESTVKLLIDRGADLRHLFIVTTSPASKSAGTAYYESTFSPNRNARSFAFAGTPLCEAAEVGSAELINALWDRGIDRGNSRSERHKALNMAIQSGRLDAAIALIDRGVPVNPPEDGNEPPISAAASSHNMEMARMLLTRGAKVNVSPAFGQPPLIAAAGSGRTEIVKLLLSAGAEVNLAYSEGQTALMKAVSFPEVVKLLLDNHAGVNGRDKSGRTPLSYAISSGDARTVELLLAHGANPILKGTQGQNGKQGVLLGNSE